MDQGGKTMAKTKTLDQLIKDIIKCNPQVDLKKVLEGHALTETMRLTGRRRGYRLALPMSGKRVYVLDDDLHDHRTVHLQKS